LALNNDRAGREKRVESYQVIGLLDHMGFGNMGDAAIHESFIQNIQRRLPSARLIAFSENPEDTTKRHNIASYPIEWRYPGCWTSGDEAQPGSPSRTSKLKALLKRRCGGLYRMARYARNLVRRGAHLKRTFGVVRSLDLLVMAGGGQLCELWGGAWSHPYNVFKFCLLAKLSGTPVFIVGVGADLLERPLSKFFAKWAVRLADYTSFRSVESQERIRQLGVKKNTHVCPDPAYSLDVQPYLVSGVDRSQRVTDETSGMPLRRVGLNPMGFCDPRIWPRKDSTIYASYLEKLTQFASWVLSRNYCLELFTSDIVVDKYALEDFHKIILDATSPDLHHRIVCRPVLDLQGLLLQMSEFDFVITTKFHGVVFSHLLEKPVIALSYMPKIDHLMKAVGQSRYCLEIEGFASDALIQAFESLASDPNDATYFCRETTASYAQVLKADFDELFGAASAKPRNGVSRLGGAANPRPAIRQHSDVY
jgi:polysaccharide pyruvyl transferase WcaK-like protein